MLKLGAWGRKFKNVPRLETCIRNASATNEVIGCGDIVILSRLWAVKSKYGAFDFASCYSWVMVEGSNVKTVDAGKSYKEESCFFDHLLCVGNLEYGRVDMLFR